MSVAPDGPDESGFQRYVNDDVGLKVWKKVDFLGMVADFGKAWFVLLMTLFAGFVLALQRSVGQMFNAGVEGVEYLLTQVLSIPQASIERAAEVATAEIQVAGFFALPVGVLVAISAVMVASLLITIFLDI